MDKRAIYRLWEYYVEDYVGNGSYSYSLFAVKEADKYPDYMRLFCGVKGFEWNKTSDMNPINTILIVVAESFEGVLEEISTNDEESVSTFVYTKDRYKHLFNK